MNVYGIDFGLTRSCIAKIGEDGIPTVIKNYEDARDALDTVVYFENADSIVIGAYAKDMVEIDGERVVQFVKRELGKANTRAYKFDGKVYSPVEICALILLRLKQIAEEQGDSIDGVVIACPNYYGLEERNALKNAGILAGLNVIGIINETTATVLSYLSRQTHIEETLLVCDLGGGSLSSSVVKVSWSPEEDKITVVSQYGTDLGGCNWDDRLFDYVMKSFCCQTGFSINEIDVEDCQLVRNRVEAMKKKLSSAASAKIKIAANGQRMIINVLREDFERITTDLVDRFMESIEKCVIGSNEIDKVLVTGGASLMPMIRANLEKRFPNKIMYEDPASSVAKGAALYALWSFVN